MGAATTLHCRQSCTVGAHIGHSGSGHKRKNEPGEGHSEGHSSDKPVAVQRVFAERPAGEPGSPEVGWGIRWVGAGVILQNLPAWGLEALDVILHPGNQQSLGQPLWSAASTTGAHCEQQTTLPDSALRSLKL